MLLFWVIFLSRDLLPYLCDFPCLSFNIILLALGHWKSLTITNANYALFMLYSAQEEIRQQVGAPSTTNTPLTDNLPTTSPLAVSMPDPMDCTKQREETQGSLLLIVLPAIIALILIVIVIVAILLCICFLRVHNQKKWAANSWTPVAGRL